MNHQEKMIQVMSPENTLNRGFALVYLKNKLMASGTEIKNEDVLTIKMKDAELISKVMENKSKHGK
jgi:exodeoxyribonuclease VII large subunit